MRVLHVACCVLDGLHHTHVFPFVPSLSHSSLCLPFYLPFYLPFSSMSSISSMSSLRTRYYMSLFDEPFVQAHTDLMRDCSIVIGKMTAEDSRGQQKTAEKEKSREHHIRADEQRRTEREGEQRPVQAACMVGPVWSKLRISHGWSSHF